MMEDNSLGTTPGLKGPKRPANGLRRNVLLCSEYLIPLDLSLLA